MSERPRFFDDMAGVAGGAFSALVGLKDEAEALVRARIDEAIRRLDLVRRDELEAVQEMAANARSAQEAAELRLAALEARLAKLEAMPQNPPPDASEPPAPPAVDPQPPSSTL
jgi:BMFP domain-containing protein YqiC